MYGQHFGFARPLFSDGMTQDEAVFRTAATQQLATDLEVALTRKDSVAILAGLSGTGKTTIASDAIKGIGTRLAFACISQPPLTAHELLEQLLTDFGFEPYKKSRVERLQQWRQFMSEMTATDTRVCLLIENAEQLDGEVLRALHNLTAADAAHSPGANVVMTTIAPPDSLLTAPELQAFRQRVRLRRSIEPLSQAEIEDYLEFKCQFANADSARIFDARVASVLHDYSAGILRVIDSLLETSLISAAANNETMVTAERLARVAEEQFGMTNMVPADVDALLDTSPTNPTAAEPDVGDIPTLTDYVSGPSDEYCQQIAMGHRS